MLILLIISMSFPETLRDAIGLTDSIVCDQDTFGNGLFGMTENMYDVIEKSTGIDFEDQTEKDPPYSYLVSYLNKGKTLSFIWIKLGHHIRNPIFIQVEDVKTRHPLVIASRELECDKKQLRKLLEANADYFDDDKEDFDSSDCVTDSESGSDFSDTK